jgi:hypothetical protein
VPATILTKGREKGKENPRREDFDSYVSSFAGFAESAAAIFAGKHSNFGHPLQQILLFALNQWRFADGT